MPTNDFLPFATAGGANVLSQAAYAGDAARLAGVIAGTARSALVNKSWRQSAVMAFVIGQFINVAGGRDALDDGDTTVLLNNFLASLRRQSLNWIGAIGGTANALTATLSPAPANWAELVGVPLRLITASANTTTTPTLNLNGLGAKTMIFADGSPLTANAWGANALIEVFYDGTNVRILSGADRGASRLINRFADSTSGTRNFTAVVTGWHEIELVGGGGGGGGAVSGSYAGGGAGGGRVVDVVFLQAGTNYSYTVGAAGAAGNPGITPATAGGSTSFVGPAGTVVANGGPGGLSGGGGVVGGGGSGFSANGYVEPGQPGYSSAPTIQQGGPGGDTTAGGFGGAPSFGDGNVGGAPGGGGSGGSGAIGNALGGNGAAGRIAIRW